MILPQADDRLSPLDELAFQGLRRRPRFSLEGQSARCPLCNRVMIVYMGVRGPTWLCGCTQAADEEKAKEC